MADSIRAVLNQAGDTEEELVAYLRGQGIKGFRHDPYQCALSVFLNRNLNGGCSTSLWEAFRGGANEDHQATRLKPHERDFVRHFDLGCYPDLETHTEKETVQ